MIKPHTSMLVVGLTGGIASGKSEVAKVLRRKGAKIISGDLIGRQVVEGNPKVLKMLVRAFGREILTKNGKLNRKKLGSLAFSSRGNQNKLNRIVHPKLLRKLHAEIAKARREFSRAKRSKKPAPGLIVIDAALITEWGLHKKLDMTVMVASPVAVRIKRLHKQGLTRNEAKARIARQMADSRRREFCDFVIKNGGSLSRLRQKAENLYHLLMVHLIFKELDESFLPV
ncbi:MAG: dephospho-CoA kinase [candidate division Zixibacteria bacterium]|nr:dephospho-CoA kinase [candidate division Zixibacteria bacterium]